MAGKKKTSTRRTTARTSRTAKGSTRVTRSRKAVSTRATRSGDSPGRAGAVAIVLGRAGSHGVPGKNMAMVGGRACAAWTIEHAMRSVGVGLVAVSSDCPHLLELARRMGVWAIMRPAGLASDGARVDDAARHALGEVERGLCRLRGSGLPERFEHVALLYANVPVRPADLTERALGALAQHGCDSVQSYEPCGKHHPWWTAKIDAETARASAWTGRVLNHGVYRRQDLPEAYVPDGGVIALRRAALMDGVKGSGSGPHAFLGVDRRGIVSGTGPDGVGVVDIDAPFDLIVADAVLQMRGRGWAAAC